MTDREAIQHALRMHPDSPGVGRLCQELLSRLSGMPITTSASIPVWRPMRGGHHGNPWGRSGKPQQVAA